MHPTLRDLLANSSLHLRTLVAGEKDRADAPLTWVHSSDLDDPARFLEPGNVVLTTGTQFLAPHVSSASYRTYVERLHRVGVAGIGFGTEVATEGTPSDLVDACREHGMPLFEVPFRVPFIAVSRYAADLIARAAHARDAWALGAQRAISRAALRTDAIGAVVTELSNQLGRWVALFDPSGRIAETAGRLPEPMESAEVADEVRRLLSRGQRAGSTVERAGVSLVVQTLGRPSRLRGALAIAGRGIPDSADQSVVTAVVALAELSLEQGRALDTAQHALRHAQLRAILTGRVDLADAIASSRHIPIPPEPVVVAVARPDSTRLEGVLNELTALEAGGGLLFALDGGRIVLLTADDGLPRRLARAHATAVGLSDAVPYAALADGVAQAERAMRSASAGSVRRFADLTSQGITALVDRADSVEVARALLAPAIAHDAEHGSSLLESATTWLAHNGQWDPAARALGIHRHTLKARITQLERLLGVSLDGFEARADLWLALRAYRGRHPDPSG